MSVASGQPEGHDAYLQTLNRALMVGLAVSVALHAVLVEFLPHPFQHDHPSPPDLQVELATIPPVAEQLKEAQRTVTEPPAQMPLRPGPVAKPEPVRTYKPAPASKQARERHTEAAPPVHETDRLLTHAEPGKAVTVVPAAAESGEVKETPAPEAATQPRDVSGEAGPETPPSFRAGYLRNPEPPYPSASRRLGEQGTVHLRVLVTAEGRPAKVDVHRSSGFARLDDAAAAAVREWRFLPAKRGTTPVEASVIVPVVFRLEVE